MESEFYYNVKIETTALLEKVINSQVVSFTRSHFNYRNVKKSVVCYFSG